MIRLIPLFALAIWSVTALAQDAKTIVPAALNFTVKDIDSKPVDLSTYSGKVILIVNVASNCGNTPQYSALESIYEKYQPKGFTILAFPANNFNSQEPGTNADIKNFCTAEDSKYKIKFPLMAKISVKGDDIAPLYKYLTSQETKPAAKGDITWNFEKFLIGKDGNILARFTPRTKPDDPALVAAIEAALGK